MSLAKIKTEEIIIDTTEYNSDEVEEDLNPIYEDAEGEIYHQKIHYSNSFSKHQDLSSPTSVSLQQQNRNAMNISTSREQLVVGGKNNLPKNILESEKRIRREIANSNERRRMQSINAGFQNLRSLLPRHEGEKLSKAAILQQTSQYICDLENQKTQLLAQNSQLKRTLGQHELALSGYGIGSGNVEDGCSAIKKHKLTDNVLSLQTISDSSDEGLGSVSPEPTTLLQNSNTTSGISFNLAKAAHGNAYITQSSKELIELKKQLEKERRSRAVIEEELRLIKRQLCSENYITREFIEQTENYQEEECPVSYISLNEKNETTGVLVCSSIEEINEDCTEIITDDNIKEEIILTKESQGKYADSSSLQPILQAAIKAQPKVEVKRINETVMKINSEKEQQPNQKKSGGNPIGLTRSRQNLETIVEAIRHLEGDHLFGDSAGQQKKSQKSQESPLALTTKRMVSKTVQPLQQQQQQRNTIAELSPFLQIKNPKIGAANVVTVVRGRTVSVTPAGDNSLTTSTVTKPSSSTTANTTISSKNNSTNKMIANNNNPVSSIISTNSSAIPTTIVKVQTAVPPTSVPIAASPSHITITTASLKQCRPGVIVAKQLS